MEKSDVSDPIDLKYKQVAHPLIQSIVPYVLSLYFILQVFIPLHHLYSGNLFWHEQAFAFHGV